MLDFSELLSASRISPHESISSKKRALESLAALLTPYAGEHNHMDVLNALAARERLGSTGLGHGIAIPHGRMEGLDKPLAAVMTLDTGIDFEAPDGEPVDILFALLIPQECNDAHLKILAALAKLFVQEDLRKALREATDAEQILQIFTAYDSDIAV
ncbi:PTS sugar transporter subunit IIA [Granulosicoccaceae sp. 1_MG-2023]|nr:PTS sugar transporter subunit IIA [Granulosicoccaceae sp. 1_MG-2023]